MQTTQILAESRGKEDGQENGAENDYDFCERGDF